MQTPKDSGESTNSSPLVVLDRSSESPCAPPALDKQPAPGRRATDVTAVLNRAIDGDQAAWTELVDRYERLVWSVTRRYGLRTNDGHDVFQTVFLLLYTHLETIRDPEKVGLWLHTTTRRECARLLKRRGRAASSVHDVSQVESPDPQLTPDQIVAASEGDYLLRCCFEQLSPACRRLLQMCLADPPATYNEISAEFGVRLGSIGAKRRRCLDRLRQLYVRGDNT